MLDYHKLSQRNDIDCRKSGFQLAIILLAMYGMLLFKGRNVPALGVVAVVLSLLAVLRARLLDRIVKFLTGLGNMMHKATNPVVFACIFVTAIIPVSLLLKLFSKDILRLKRDAACTSYWILRPAVSWKDSFRNLF